MNKGFLSASSERSVHERNGQGKTMRCKKSLLCLKISYLLTSFGLKNMKNLWTDWNLFYFFVFLCCFFLQVSLVWMRETKGTDLSSLEELVRRRFLVFKCRGIFSNNKLFFFIHLDYFIYLILNISVFMSLNWLIGAWRRLLSKITNQKIVWAY